MGYANLYAGWIGVFLGFVAGAIPGLFFDKDDWLGGYGSWRRRMIRLAHISFFGIGFINVLFALTIAHMELYTVTPISSWLLIVGAITMPVLCYLSAYRKVFRHLFFIPVLCLLIGTGLLILKGFL